MTAHSQLYSVLTGDVVGYTKMPSRERMDLVDVLHDAHRRLGGIFDVTGSADIDVFRGDSWQFVLAKPEQSLRAAVFFRAFLLSRLDTRSVDTCLAIGIGRVDFLPSARTPTGDGEAFRKSGLALDKMPRHRRMRINGPESIGIIKSETLDVLVSLIDAVIRQWTPRQAFAVCGAIAGQTQDQIGLDWAERKVSQQAIGQHLEKAQWSTVDAALNHFESQWLSYLAPEAQNGR